MSPKKLVVSVSLLEDPRVPAALRDHIYLALSGASGIMGATDLERTTVFLDVSVVREACFGDFLGMAIRTIDHEYAHAFAPAGNSSPGEERLADRFEAAGAWARSAT